MVLSSKTRATVAPRAHLVAERTTFGALSAHFQRSVVHLTRPVLFHRWKGYNATSL